MSSDGSRWQLVTLAALIVLGSMEARSQSTPAAQTGKRGAGLTEEIRQFRTYPHLDRAYRLINSNKLAEAKRELEACLELDRHDAGIWSTYLDVVYRLKEYDTLAARFDELGDLRGDARLRRYHMLAQLERHQLDAVFEDLRALSGRSDQINRSELQRIAARFIDLARDQKRPDLLVALLSTAPEAAVPPPIAYQAANALRSLGRASDAGASYQRIAKAADAGKLRAEAYKALASLSIEQQRQSQGREFLTRAHELQPGDPSIIHSLGELALAREDWGDCIRWYRQWLNISKDASREDRHQAAMVIGRAYVQLGQLDRAAEAFSLALRVRPNDVEALVAVAQVEEQQGRLVEALGNLRAALGVAPTGDLNAQVGLLSAQLGHPKVALAYLERARDLGVSPALAPALFGQLGYTYAALDQPKAAREAFEKALPQSPNQAAIYAALGYASLSLQDFPSAVKHFERSLSLQDNPRLWKDLALAYARAGNSDGVARSVDHLRPLPDGTSQLDPAVWNQLAENAFRNGRFGEAATLFRQAFAHSNGEGWSALNRAAESFERAEAFSDAMVAWEEIAASNHASADLRAGAAERAGYLHLRLNDPERAASSFLLAIRLGHDTWQLRLDRALTLIKLTRWNEALDESLASLHSHNSARGQIAAALCFKSLNKPGMAIHHFSQGLEAAGELESAEQKYVLDELTTLYANEANYEGSSKAAASSLRISADPSIALRLARMQRQLGRNEEAGATLDAVDTSSLPKPLKLAMLDERAFISNELGDKRQALRALDEAAQLDPSDRRLFELGSRARDVGDFEKAVAAMRASVDAAPGNLRYREALGYTYLQAGQLKSAADALATVVDQEPDNLQVQQDLAGVLMRLGDRPGALQRLRQVIARAGSDTSHRSTADGNTRQERQDAVLRMRSSVAQLSKSYEGAAYFGYQSLAAPNGVIDRNAPPLLLSQGGFELARYLTGPERGLSLIGRVMAIGALGLLGSASQPTIGFDPQGAISQLGVGLKYKPFASENLNFSAERLIQLRGNLPDFWLARVLYGKEIGADLKADERWHPYSLIYGDVAGFIGRYQSVLAYGEARLGASWSMNNSWAVRPHLVAMARRDLAGSAADAFQFGAGLGITHYFREDGFVGPAPSLELRIYGTAAGIRPLDTKGVNGVKGLTVVSTVRF